MAKALSGTESKAEEDREAASEKNNTMAKRRARSGDLIRNGDTRMTRSLQASRKAKSH